MKTTRKRHREDHEKTPKKNCKRRCGVDAALVITNLTVFTFEVAMYF